MFGKNYDKEIENLWEAINVAAKQLNKNIKTLGELIEICNSLQDQLISSSLVIKQHKEIITFLLKNTSIDSEGQKDLIKLLSNTREINDKLKEKK